MNAQPNIHDAKSGDGAPHKAAVQKLLQPDGPLRTESADEPIRPRQHDQIQADDDAEEHIHDGRGALQPDGRQTLAFDLRRTGMIFEIRGGSQNLDIRCELGL